MHVAGYEVSIRIPDAQSLKDRRQVVRSIVDTLQQRCRVSVAEVGGQDTWQRATIGVAVVASEARLVEAVIADVDRLLWARTEIEVLDAELRWLE